MPHVPLTCIEVWVIEHTLPVKSVDTLDIFSTILKMVENYFQDKR